MVALISSALCLAGVEILLRFCAQWTLHDAEWMSVGQVVAWGTRPLGFSLRPGSSRLEIKGGEFTLRVTINARGLRDVEHAVGRQARARRILVLGDSFMYGWGVPMDESMPRILASLLPGVELINSGVPGYDLGQEYLYDLSEGYRYEPDLVIEGFFINDLVCYKGLSAVDRADGVPFYYEPDAGARAREAAAAMAGPLQRVSALLRDHCALYALERRRLETLGGRGGRAAPELEDATPSSAQTGPRPQPPYLPAFHADPPGVVSRDWQRALNILDGLKRQVEARGARLVLVLIPAPWQITEDDWRRYVAWWGVPESTLSWMKPQETVGSWCRRTRTPCLDLLDALGGKDSRRLYLPRDFHWTSEGHRLAAMATRDFLVRERLP